MDSGSLISSPGHESIKSFDEKSRIDGYKYFSFNEESLNAGYWKKAKRSIDQILFRKFSELQTIPEEKSKSDSPPRLIHILGLAKLSAS